MNSRVHFRFVLMAALLALFLAAFAFAVGPTLAASISIRLDQCANGGSGENPECLGKGSSGWVSGNVNTQKAHYFIDDFLPYRRVFTGLTPSNQYCFAMAWDITKGGLPAIDYISTYNLTLADADPTDGTGFDDGDPNTPPVAPTSTAGIPVDGALQNGFIDYGTGVTGTFTGTEVMGELTMWGGTLDTQANGDVSPGVYSNTGLDPNTSQPWDVGANFENALEYCFVANQSEVVMAWSGHIADPADWSAPGRPTGSPYHMANGSKLGVFTAPRNSETDLADTTPGGTTTHQNFGRMEIQLDIGIQDEQPTAITLSNFSVGSGADGAPFALAAVTLVALATSAILVLRRRRGVTH